MEEFEDRTDAGRRLAEALAGLALHRPIVLGVPRGGVVVGAAIAAELGAELDVVLARKLRAPGQPELALGAVSESGQVWLDRGVDPDDPRLARFIEEERRRQMAEIGRSSAVFRAARVRASFEDRSVVVTDDGIATGSTVIAALQAVRAERPREIILAVPVASADRLRVAAALADEAVCLVTPERFIAVGFHYRDFGEVTDDQVVEILRRYGGAAGEAGRSER